MASYILTRKAVEDLSKIWDYTFEVWSEAQADKYYFMIIDSCQELADNKVSGKFYPEVQDEILGYKIGQHIIFYRHVKGDKIEVARILHSRMDLKNRLTE
jgi:toxin ParE1/3/4